MSRRGNGLDNAPMGSFFPTRKVELVRQRRWATREQARRDLFAYSEGYDDRPRIYSALGAVTLEQAQRQRAS